MKILIITAGFFPGKKYGGPPVSVDNFCSLMKDECDCFIVTHNHDMGESTEYGEIESGWNNRGNAKVLYLSDKEYTYQTFFQVAKNLRPDIIYLQGLFQNSIFPCLRIARQLRINVVLAPRGELCSGAFHKRYKKVPYILILRMLCLLKNVTFQSTSNEETEAIHRHLSIPYERIHLLTNIPSIPNNLPENFIKNVGVGRFVFISRILWKKNLLSAIHYFNNISGIAVFDIYGPLEDKKYWNECCKAIKQLPSNISVNYKGILSHEKIHETFRQYDAFLFPTFSENYGHVIAESLVTGCIPIISDQTPWNDMNEAEAGWALPLENESEFVEVIKKVIEMDDKEIQLKRNKIKVYIERKMKVDVMKKEYLAVFKR